VRVVAAILAAGKGSRYGADKCQTVLKGKPLWRHSFDTLASHEHIAGVGIICPSGTLESYQKTAPDALFVVQGGETRSESAKAAVGAAHDAEILLIHDGARPFPSHRMITDVIQGVIEFGAAAPGIAVTNTIRRRTESGTEALDRKSLIAMQTPQGARTELLRQAFASSAGEYTDEMSLLEAYGVQPQIVEGEPSNFKITTPEDMARALALLGPPETRTGIGYDIHPFSTNPERKCVLGGVTFEDAPGLEGHSDADVLIHAIVDSLLGAAGLGDIGQHFPNTDEKWRDRESLYFLQETKRYLAAEGWRILNIDATLIAELPKVMKKAEAIRTAISGALALDSRRVSVKATTNERLGSLGRGEGIAAFAVATLTESA
jgi:2-C-methyl-D-erythritol 4-phosphate cytidylyltransferase/2-C-methyl-D-erythritol 2,4-cyclodiphosphate synthase